MPGGTFSQPSSPNPTSNCNEHLASVAAVASKSKHIKDGIPLNIIKGGQKTAKGVSVSSVIEQRLEDILKNDDQNVAWPQTMSLKHRSFAQKHPDRYIQIMTQYLTNYFKVYSSFLFC